MSSRRTAALVNSKDDVWCWGQSDDGALGLGPVGDGSATTPQQLMRPDNQPLIASGFWTGPTNNCALRSMTATTAGVPPICSAHRSTFSETRST